jgi:hypothetical protein
MIAGAIDLHVHCAPDVRPRKITALELAQTARRAEMAGLLLKNHEFSTAALAATVMEAVGGIKVFGGVVLNTAVGGLNPAAVEAAIRVGAKQVWMPTHCAEQERAYRQRAGTGISIFDVGGEIRPEVQEIMRLVAEADIILGTGHLSAAEVGALIRAARKAGVRKILVNHPEIEFLQFSPAWQREIAGPDVWFERCYLRENFVGTWDALASSIRATSCEHNVLATDLGQADSLDPVTGLDRMQTELTSRGFSAVELRLMCNTNPAVLLNLT